jgi:hypothetical protein
MRNTRSALIARHRVAALAVLTAFVAAGFGCGPRLQDPTVLVTPYGETQYWAVAPLHNESGVSVVDTLRMSDILAKEAQQAHGVRVAPVNRVLAAMRDLDMPAISSAIDAQTLMNVLDLDGLLVGTITDYDPYRPMTLGLAVELYTRPRDDSYAGVDSRALTASTGGGVDMGDFGPPRPTAQTGHVFDASNHQVLKWLEDYAAGRVEPESAYGRDIYLVSMDWYAQFVCHRTLLNLLRQEWARLRPAAKKS